MNNILQPRVVYEDDALIAVNKPAGLLTHGTSHEEPSLAEWLVDRFPYLRTVGEDPTRPGIVHRLDRDTSGIVLIAKTQQSFIFLKTLFQERRTQKTYRAIVHGITPSRGTIEKSIGREAGSVKQSVFSARGQKEAVTEYERVATYHDNRGNEFSLVLAYPKTGRTHQIRVHFAAIGHPIAGDRLYGGKKHASAAPRQMLHAESIAFTDETGRALRISADPPADFAAYLRSLTPITAPPRAANVI